MNCIKKSALIVLMLLIQKGYSQSFTLDIPRKSQAAKVEQRIGISDLSVSYHRPAAKERKVWGGLVPYDGGQPIPWRAGANENTVFTTSTDINVEGTKLAAGTYSLHMIASEDKATVIFNTNIASWGSYSYNQQLDAIRVEADIVEQSPYIEFLTYQFTNLSNTGGELELQWADKKVVIEIQAETNELTYESIKQQLQVEPGWTWLGWYEAANFCYQNEIHLNQGLQWAGRSVFNNPNSQNLLLMAQLSAKVKNAENEQEAIVDNLSKNLAAQPVTWKEYNSAANYCLVNNVSLEKGLEFASQSVKMNPKMSNQMNKALILEALGRGEESKEIKTTALESSSNAELNQFAYSLLYGGKTKESLEYFEYNAKKNPKDPNVFDSLGEAYFRNGMTDKAKKAFKTSLSLNPPANVRGNTMNFLNQMGVSPEEL